MSFILDTNVVSELRKPVQRIDAGVRSWARATPSHVMYLSVVSVMEIALGVARLERRDTQQGTTLRHWFDERVLAAFASRILPVDLPVARQAAALHIPDPRPDRDALIAATGLVHGFTVVTRNEADFAPMEVPIVNPWST